jgi:hypothetical protein
VPVTASSHASRHGSWQRTRDILLALMVVTGCSNSATKPGQLSEDSSTCQAGCESNLWPRAIINLLPPQGFTGDEVQLASMRGRFGDLMQDGRPHGCPTELPETLRCSYSFFATPADRTFELIVAPTDGAEFQQEVKLGPFNTCGRSIAYVTVDLAPAARTISESRFVSPCSGL